MSVDRRAYATEAFDTINKLVQVGGATGGSAPPYYGYLGSVTNAFIPLLTIAIQQSGVAKVTYPAALTDGQFQQLVKVLHRGYYVSLLTAVEGGCVRIPTKPATHSNRKPATDSDLKPAGIPI